MRVLIAWGSKRGGTERIAKIVAETLAAQGHQVHAASARVLRRGDIEAHDAVVIGGALYANRWQRDARNFVSRNLRALRRVPVWCFSSGPLDRSAESSDIPPCPEVSVLMDLIGARGHMTFGGRLAADARGFPASAMAKKHSGDFRSPDQIRAWAAALAQALPDARPGMVVTLPGRSLWRLVTHAVSGWLLCVGLMALLSQVFAPQLAAAVHAAAAPLIFVAIARHYFRVRGARQPVLAALSFAGLVVLLDATLIAGLLLRTTTLLVSVAQFWLPVLLIFVATWATGSILAMVPEQSRRAGRQDQARSGDASSPQTA